MILCITLNFVHVMFKVFQFINLALLELFFPIYLCIINIRVEPAEVTNYITLGLL